MKWTFIAFLLFLVSLFFREQQLPDWAVERICDQYSSDSLHIMCGRAYIGFSRGIRLVDVRILDSTRRDAFNEVASIRWMSVSPWLRKVTLCELEAKRLGDDYYKPGNISRDEPVEVQLPELGEFRLELIRPCVLGLVPESVTATVKVSPAQVKVDEVVMRWPGNSSRLRLGGEVEVDFARQQVVGYVDGRTYCELIRPLLVALDVPIAVEYMDAFSEVPTPVRARCDWTVNLRNNDLELTLDLHPKLGRYRGMRMARADGVVTVRGWCRDDNYHYSTTVGPLVASDEQGRTLDGSLTVSGSRTEPARIELDAVSKLELPTVLAFSEVLADGTLAALECQDAPELSFKGVLATCVEDQSANQLFGHGKFGRVRFLDIPFNSAALDFAYVGSEMTFSNLTAVGSHGGEVSGMAQLSIPGLNYSNATYSLNLKYENGSIDELAESFGLDKGKRRGTLAATIALNAPMNENCLSQLCGSGRVEVTEGRLAQMRLFAGMTDLLAASVPGIESVINQSTGSFDFTIENGKLTASNVLIEGALFSFRAEGTVDLVTGELDFRARIQFWRKDSLVDKVVWPVTWTFSKLFTEFHVGGTLKQPKWQYLSIVDKIL